MARAYTGNAAAVAELAKAWKYDNTFQRLLSPQQLAAAETPAELPAAETPADLPAPEETAEVSSCLENATAE